MIDMVWEWGWVVVCVVGGEGEGEEGVILAPQTTAPIYLGVDNLNAVRHVSRLVSGVPCVCPFELCTYDDLLTLVADSFVNGIGTHCSGH